MYCQEEGIDHFAPLLLHSIEISQIIRKDGMNNIFTHLTAFPRKFRSREAILGYYLVTFLVRYYRMNFVVGCRGTEVHFSNQ